MTSGAGLRCTVPWAALSSRSPQDRRRHAWPSGRVHQNQWNMAISRRGIRTGVVLLALTALGTGAYLRISSASTAGDGDPVGPGPGAAPPTAVGSSFSTDVAIAVEGAEAVRDTLVLSVSAAGEAEAWRWALVTAEVAGRVEEVAVRESDRVDAGEVVLTLDPVDKQLAVEEARAGLRQAEGQYREQLLFDDDLPEDVRREREAAARVKSGLDRAEIQLRRAELDQLINDLVMIQAALGGDDAILPTRYVFDEGHHLFDAADSAFSAHLTGRETADLRRWLLGPEDRGRSRGRGLRQRLGAAGAALGGA